MVDRTMAEQTRNSRGTPHGPHRVHLWFAFDCGVSERHAPQARQTTNCCATNCRRSNSSVRTPRAATAARALITSASFTNVPLRLRWM